MGSTHGCWRCWLVSLWDDSQLRLKGHGDQQRFLSTGRKRMSLPSSRKARRRICETTRLSASPQSVGRWWSNFPWKTFPNIKARNLTGISHKHKKNFFTVRVVKHWNRMPREVMEFPYLEILKTQLVMALSNSEQQGWSIFRGACQPQPLCGDFYRKHCRKHIRHAQQKLVLICERAVPEPGATSQILLPLHSYWSHALEWTNAVCFCNYTHAYPCAGGELDGRQRRQVFSSRSP